jgi:hypothetical protein
MSKEKLVIIDADSLIYSSSKETLEESIQILNEKIQNIYDKTEATHSIFLISKGKYFRHDVFSGYKQNRGKYTSTLKWLKTLKCYLEENYNAYWMKGAEADDIAAWLMNQTICSDTIRIETKETFESVNCILQESGESPVEFNQIDVVLAAVDKDLIKSIVGVHFNYSYVLEDKTKAESVIKGSWVTTSESDARGFQRGQLVFGDVGDGVTGIPKKGEKYWEKMCLAGKVNLTDILEEYIIHYGESQGIYEFQKNYRLLHLLSTDADFMQEIGELPAFPTVNLIVKEIKIEYI